jgi:hypothetical protein
MTLLGVYFVGGKYQHQVIKSDGAVCSTITHYQYALGHIYTRISLINKVVIIIPILVVIVKSQRRAEYLDAKQ